MTMNKRFFTYILLTEHNKLYTGYTVDVEKRFKAHESGDAKFTRANKPVKIMYISEHDTKSEAMKEEIRIKKLSRSQKELLIEEYNRKLLS